MGEEQSVLRAHTNIFYKEEFIDYSTSEMIMITINVESIKRESVAATVILIISCSMLILQ